MPKHLTTKLRGLEANLQAVFKIPLWHLKEFDIPVWNSKFGITNCDTKILNRPQFATSKGIEFIKSQIVTSNFH